MSVDRTGADPRELTDVRTMRAVTHPVRLALLEALVVEGSMTATAAGEVIGESPSSCSFHFRQLQKYGFVEEDRVGPGRTRTWRLSRLGIRLSDTHDNPEANLAARALDKMLRHRYFQRLQAFYEHRDAYPAHWKEVTGSSQSIVHVTPDELRDAEAEIAAVLDRFRARATDQSLRPEGALPVEVLIFAYPIHHPQPEE